MDTINNKKEIFNALEVHSKYTRCTAMLWQELPYLFIHSILCQTWIKGPFFEWLWILITNTPLSQTLIKFFGCENKLRLKRFLLIIESLFFYSLSDRLPSKTKPAVYWKIRTDCRLCLLIVSNCMDNQT